MNADTLNWMLFLMWQVSENQRKDEEILKLRRVIHAEYENYSRGTNRLREYRHPVNIE